MIKVSTRPHCYLDCSAYLAGRSLIHLCYQATDVPKFHTYITYTEALELEPDLESLLVSEYPEFYI